MKNFVIRLFVNALALTVASQVISGIHLTGGLANVLVVALLFGVLNALLKPVLLFLSLPFLLVTLGLFAFVVNGMLLLITARLTDRLVVDGLGAAILGSLVISLVTMVMGHVLDDHRKRD